MMGLSQEKLGQALGLTFQQVQKYERGANKVGASRLFEMSKVLEVPIGFFFDGMSGESRTNTPVVHNHVGFAEAPATFGGPPPKRAEQTDDTALFAKKETIDLVRAYYRIPDAGVRKRTLDLIRSTALAMHEET